MGRECGRGAGTFTVTGLYGSEENRLTGVLGDNTQHAVELHAPAVATAYQTEFEEM
jgi:hypothetical protein